MPIRTCFLLFLPIKSLSNLYERQVMHETDEGAGRQVSSAMSMEKQVSGGKDQWKDTQVNSEQVRRLQTFAPQVT